MAKLSLQEQLLKSGLVSDAHAKKIKSDKNKQQRLQQKNKLEVVDEAKLLAQQAQESKQLKDRELNQILKEEAEQKSVAAQIKQLVVQNAVMQDPEGIAYRFNDAGLVKTIYVGERQRQQLIDGKLAIVGYAKQYYCVPRDIGVKLRERDPALFILLNDAITESVEDDPYAAYAIPDDLMW